MNATWLGLFLACIISLAGCVTTEQLALRNSERLMAEGKYEDAVRAIESATNENPNGKGARINLLRVRDAALAAMGREADVAVGSGRDEDAQALYRRMKQIDPENAYVKQRLEDFERASRGRDAMTRASAAFQNADLPMAERLVRQAISLDSNNAQAHELLRKILEAHQTNARTNQGVHGLLAKPIALDFRDVPIRAVLDIFAKSTGVSIVLDKDVSPDQKVTITVRSMPSKEALNLVLQANQLEYRVLSAQSILVYPSTAAKQKEHQALNIKTYFLTNADPKQIANSIRTLVKTRDVVVDEKLNLVIVRDTPEAIQIIDKIVSVQDLAEPEVMLEVAIMEIKRSKLLELGVRFPEQLQLTPLASSTGSLTLADLAKIRSSTTAATVSPLTLNARNELSNTNLLASPKIRVRNRDKARILIGERVPNITTNSNVSGFISETVQYIDVGLKLEVEPTISLDDEVAIKIQLEVSSILSQVTTRSGSQAFRIGTRLASTVLRLKNGENQILAGLINDEERSTTNRVPGLGATPVLGRLFGSTLDSNDQTEIVLSITPRLVRQLKRMDPSQTEFDSGTDSSLRSRGEVPVSQSPASPPSPSSQAPRAVPPSPVSPQPPAGGPTSAPLSPGAAAPPGTGSVRLSGPSVVRTGNTYTVQVSVSSADVAGNYPMVISFNPKMVQVVAVQEIPQPAKPEGSPATVSSRIDGVGGQVFLAASSTDGSAIRLDGPIANIQLKAIAAQGSSAVSILNAQAINASGASASLTIGDATTAAITP